MPLAYLSTIYKCFSLLSPFQDVIATGASVLETAKLLRQHGLVVDLAIVFLNRDQGGQEVLEEAGIKMRCVTDISKLMSLLKDNGRVGQETVDRVTEYVKNNKVTGKTLGELNFSEIIYSTNARASTLLVKCGASYDSLIGKK